MKKTYGKPRKKDKPVAGKSKGGVPEGMRQTYKQTGKIMGMKSQRKK